MLRPPAQMRQAARQTGDILAVDFDELQRIAPARAAALLHLRMHRLDQRAFAHAARAPEQRIVGRKPAREILRVRKQRAGHPVHRLQQPDGHPVDMRHGQEPVLFRKPRKRVRRGEIRHGRRRRRQALQRFGNAEQCGLEGRGGVFHGHGAAKSAAKWRAQARRGLEDGRTMLHFTICAMALPEKLRTSRKPL